MLTTENTDNQIAPSAHASSTASARRGRRSPSRLLAVAVLGLSTLGAACQPGPMEPGGNTGGNNSGFECESWGEDEAPQALYQVDGDGLRLIEGKAQKWHVETWARFAELIPANARTDLACYEAHPASLGGAWVAPEDDRLDNWRMAIGRDRDLAELDHTLIHEFAHLWTLDDGVLDTRTGPRGCSTYHPGEGCPRPGSVLRSFVETFWSDADLAAVQRENNSNDPYAGEDGAYDRYRRAPGRYVSDYAATNPAEDLAETFSHFVLESRPTGNSVADRKVRLLWDSPAAVNLRTQIRASL